MPSWPTLRSIGIAQDRIAPHILKTPVVEAEALSSLAERRVVLKLENLQSGGSFKRRGVINRLLQLTDEERAKEVIAVSGGNFGIALAEAARELGMTATIILPRSAPALSANRIETAGARIIWAETVEEAFATSENLANQGGLLLDDCDDMMISEGSATLALEFLETHPELTDLIVSVGGGSMIAGVSCAAKAIKPYIRVWGVEALGADVMRRSFDAGCPIRTSVTSRISTLGVPTISQVFFDIAQENVHEIVVVSDDEAFAGAVSYAEEEHVWAEPAAGAIWPATLAISRQLPTNAVIGALVCGGNTSVAALADHGRA